MSISYEGIGAWCATFAAGTGAEEGKVVKVSANGTVSKCAANDGFCGVVAAMGRDGKACSVQLSGLVRVPYSGETALGKSYLGALRREVRRLMLVADETLDGAVAESVTEKLGERELLELKKAFGARAAKKLGTNVQIGNPREKREENERDFCV